VFERLGNEVERIGLRSAMKLKKGERGRLGALGSLGAFSFLPLAFFSAGGAGLAAYYFAFTAVYSFSSISYFTLCSAVLASNGFFYSSVRPRHASASALTSSVLDISGLFCLKVGLCCP